MNAERILYLASIAILLFIIGIFYGSDDHPFSERITEPTIDLSGGSYLRFVFIGSSTCPFSNNDDMHEMVSYVKDELNTALSANSMNFIATGISADVSGNIGRRYLEHTGPYNELIAGGGTFNLGVINYA